jgi:hypothetical protein
LLNNDFSDAKCVHSFWDATRLKLFTYESYEALEKATFKAKKARFEHGENLNKRG